MTDKIDYRETPEFQKDFKRLLKKYRSLEEDFSLAKKAAIELHHLKGINNNAVFPIPEFCREPVMVFKLKKFACKSLFGRGVKSGIRVIYAFNSLSFEADFIEIYCKNEKPLEDRDRIKAYLKQKF